jgi:hypothetical protein
VAYLHGPALASDLDQGGEPDGPGCVAPDRGAAAAMLVPLLDNAWPLPADLEPGEFQASLATMIDAVQGKL